MLGAEFTLLYLLLGTHTVMTFEGSGRMRGLCNGI
jgi:hypothetical protein